MKKLTQGLCALFTFGLATALVPSHAADVATLSILNTPSVAEETSLVLEEYLYQSLAQVYTFQQYRKLDTTVNRISMGGSLQFIATEDNVSIYVNVLTDLNGNGYYEWVDSTGSATRYQLSNTGTLVTPSSDIQKLSSGQRCTLSVSDLLAVGMESEQARIADGTTPLYGISLVDSGNIVYCISMESSSGSTQSYYFQLDYNLDTTTPITSLGAGVFSDVPSWAWYWDEVDWAVRQGLLNGESATLFNPDGYTTRASLLQVLYLQAGAPSATLATFSDVSKGDWYADAVSWGYANGLVNGYDDGSFQPNTALTREQLAVIVYNATKQSGGSVDATDNLYSFSDGATTSSWAKEAVGWAVASNILDAEDGGLLNPQGSVSRAILASVLITLNNL